MPIHRASVSHAMSGFQLPVHRSFWLVKCQLPDILSARRDYPSMKSTRTPLGLIQHSIAALGINFLAIPMGLAPWPPDHLVAALVIPPLLGTCITWSYKAQLQTGIRAGKWSEDELDAASAWIESPHWTWFYNVAYVAFMAIWLVETWHKDFVALGFMMVYPCVLMIDALRESVRSPNVTSKRRNWWVVPLRARALKERALRALPSTGVPPPPPQPWKFELYQYPKKRD